jgi:NADH-quinone oxidoreductase subunit L
VIHAMHHEQDMRYYGGLRKHIPLTFWGMMMGTLAITGVGLPAVFGNPVAFGFAGFHSKDAIIEGAWAAGQHGASIVGTIVALLTSFYSWRLMFLTFWGKPRWEQSEHIQHALHAAHGHDHDHDDHGHDHAHAHADHGHGPAAHSDGTGGYHPHESPFPMLIPLILLSVGAVLAGFVFHGYFIEPSAGEAYWHGAIAFNEHLMHAMHEVPLGVKLSASVAMLLGLLGAYIFYIRSPEAPGRLAATYRPIYLFLLNKWYFDELYNLLFVKPAFALGSFFWHRGDEKTINRLGPDGAAWVVERSARVAGRVQSGYVYTYAFVMLLGLTGAVTWAINIWATSK